ncbi:uncharacterized protein [Notothenia coriiceps]|uniref:Uncharacterized protein n=1 Tax=Notothenia coriiceps TaxID=8208 RepID=A0A6I9P9B1_9TELE|nr:PREDICTED: uncharacterized protein LOC104958277 [Notothenia coriiceps]
MGDVLQFIKKMDVTGIYIQQAPIIESKRQINVRCLGTEGQTESLECCVQSPFKVNWFKDSPNPFAGVTENGNQFCRTYKRPLGEWGGSTSPELTCKVDNLEYRRVTTLNIFVESFTCKDADYGDGRQGDKSIKKCPTGQEGDKSAECDDGEWRLLEDSCVIKVIKELLVSSEELQEKDVPDFVEDLSKDVNEVKKEVRESPNTISTIVEILGNIADFPTLVVNQPVIEVG